MAGSTLDDDDESVLDIADQHNRPADVAINQQRIPAWHPILDPTWVIVALLALGVMMVPVGFFMKGLDKEIVEVKITYDDSNSSSICNDAFNPHPVCRCGINSTYNANRTCELQFTIPKDMKAPVLMYYELTNFHQNYRKYTQSLDVYQLAGKVGSQTTLNSALCEPLNKLGNITINPCGLIANTFFNDYFTLLPSNGTVDPRGNPLVMQESGIAWQSDLQYIFAQPEGFKSEECPAAVGCNEECCNGEDWSCTHPYVDRKGDGKCYRYFYPEDNTTQYLYETYPDIISPLEGVTNEHFVVWMRVATMPTFRKLYAWFDQPIKAGTVLALRVNANYAVERFKGSKSLILTTNNIFGGSNPSLAEVFYIVGFVCIAAGAFFALKQFLRPRKLADRAYLHYKED